jgi:alkylated DNA repair dioxygenase AlkB
MQSDSELLDSALFEYHPHFLPEREADRVFERLWRELDWSQREITLFGRRLMQPRLIAWYGDPGAVYSYSGLTLAPLPWHPLLQQLKTRVEGFSGSRFDSVLANAYRDGRDSMGWHSDDEKELGPEPVIASLSLGAPRRFLLRPKTRPAGERGGTIAVSLAHGSMLLMKGVSQQRFQHSLPRTKRPVGLRINLTYRRVGSQAPV